MMKRIHDVRMDALCASCVDDNRMDDELNDNIDYHVRVPKITDILGHLNQEKDNSKSLEDILGDALAERNDQNMITIPATLLTDIMNQQQKLTDVTTEHNANAFISKLYECVASHYENGDRTGAEAILNAIGYAQQEMKNG